MKVCFPKYSLGAFLAKKRGRCPTWLIGICWLTFMYGTYVLTNYFGLWVMLGLGIAGISVGGSAYAFLNLNRINRTHRARAKKSVPRSTSGWEYRPKDAARRDAPVDREGSLSAEAVGSSRSSPNENGNVWLNFTNLESTVEAATTKVRLSADSSKVSAYD